MLEDYKIKNYIYINCMIILIALMMILLLSECAV